MAMFQQFIDFREDKANRSIRIAMNNAPSVRHQITVAASSCSESVT